MQWVNHQRSAWIVTVISLVVIIIHSNRWVHSFHSKRPKAFTLSLSLLTLLISTALINAHSNYSLMEITVSYFIRNPLFESFQMGVHRLDGWCCWMRRRVRVLTGHPRLSPNLSSENEKRPVKNWVMDYVCPADFWCHQCGICPTVSVLSCICLLCSNLFTRIFHIASFLLRLLALQQQNSKSNILNKDAYVKMWTKMGTIFLKNIFKGFIQNNPSQSSLVIK